MDEFEQDYCPEKAIWWYTQDSFLFHVLNRSFWLLEADVIGNMGFFMRDPHRRIQELHSKQFRGYAGENLVVYRGQGFTTTDFEKLQKTRGKLMAFNSFISISWSQKEAVNFAREASCASGIVGVILVMTIDPNIASTSFASLAGKTVFEAEKEILFSMHAVFRVGNINLHDEKHELYEVQLILTSDNDPHLQKLTERLNQEAQGANGWNRAGELAKTKLLYHSLLTQSSNQRDYGYYYHQLADIKKKQGDHKESIRLYQKALTIYEKTLSSNLPSLAIS